MKKIILALGITAFLFSSCDKLPVIDGTAAQKMANEWWITLDSAGKVDYSGIGHFKIATYNTSVNNDSLWIDDLNHGWGVKFKAKADYNNLSFIAGNAPNSYSPITVNLIEGKILLMAGHSKSGNVVDSIHMKVEFSDDPGAIYEMNGHARTRFTEDDY